LGLNQVELTYKIYEFRGTSFFAQLYIDRRWKEKEIRALLHFNLDANGEKLEQVRDGGANLRCKVCSLK
jgi:hypothetical protein